MIEEIDLGKVVAAARRDRQRGGQAQRIGDERAVIIVRRAEADRRRVEAAILRSIDKEARRRHLQRRINHPDFRRGCKVDGRVIDTAAQHKMVLVPKQVAGVGGLQRDADRNRVDVLEIIFANGNSPAVRQVGDRAAARGRQRRHTVRLT